MSAVMKSVLVSTWLTVSWILGQVGGQLGATELTIDWGRFGYAFLGSTAFVVWEIVSPNPTNRPGLHRAGLIFIGMVVALALTGPICTRWDFPPETVAIVLGAIGYKLFSYGQKRADKPAEIIKDMTGLNDTKS